MKKIILIIMMLFIPIFGFSQEKDKMTDDVTITINISKINRTVGNVIGFFKSEIKEYKKDIDECLPEEKKESYKNEYNKTKKVIKEGFKSWVDAAHTGFREGLQGKKYNQSM